MSIKTKIFLIIFITTLMFIIILCMINYLLRLRPPSSLILVWKRIHSEGKDVLSICFSPDGYWLASGGLDGTIKIWRVRDGNLFKIIRIGISIKCISWSPCGRNIAIACPGGIIKILRTNDWKLIKVIKSKNVKSVSPILFSPDGNFLVSGGGFLKEIRPNIWKVVGGGIKVWQTKDWKLLKILNPDKGINWLSFTPDASYLASAEADKFIRVWELPEFILVKELAIDEIPKCIVFSPNGKLLFIGAGYEVIFWKFLEEDISQKFLTCDESIDNLVFSSNGRFLAIKSRSSITFYQIIDKKRIFKLYIPYAKWLAQITPCYIIAFSPDSKLLAIGDENGYVHLYKIKDGYIR